MSGCLQTLDQLGATSGTCKNHFGTMYLNNREDPKTRCRVGARQTISIEDQTLASHSLHGCRELTRLVGVLSGGCAVSSNAVQHVIDTSMCSSKQRCLILSFV